MEKKEFTYKVGDMITIEREVSLSTGMDYHLLRLEGGLALVSIDILPHPSHWKGAPETKTFVFHCIRPGKAAIQFGLFHASDPSHILYEEVLPVEIGSNDVQYGEWSTLRDLTEHDREVFNAALKDFVGVAYEPLQVASQLVAGTNYCFICHAKTSTLHPQEYNAQVMIFAPLPGAGTPIITSIVRIPK